MNQGRTPSLRAVVGVVGIAIGLCCGSARAQSVYTLGFAGEDALSGSEGATVQGNYDCTLAQEGGTDAGAQGWSISVRAEGATMQTFTTTGTAADPANGIYSGGFNKTEVIDPAKNAGKQGGVSAVVLSFTEKRELPVNSTQVITKATIAAVIPPAEGAARLSYEDDLTGSGQPVPNNVTESGVTVTPAKGEKIVSLVPTPDCCPSELNVGFTPNPVSSAAPYDGIVDDGAGLCLASGGTISVDTALGALGATTVYASVSSKLETLGSGVQGWSFSIAVDDLTITSVTTAGTSVPDYYSGGFNKTEKIDPSKAANAGQDGVVSAIVLSFTEKRELPVAGTESVLAIAVESPSEQGEDEIVGHLRFQTGLTGSGQPVKNAITVAGATSEACNFSTAAAAVAFVPAKEGDFLRGDPNDDGKVNIADTIWIINELFRGGQPTICQDAADVNNDGTIDSSDAVYILSYDFGLPSPSVPPAFPFPSCGKDPEGDADGLICTTTQTSCKPY